MWRKVWGATVSVGVAWDAGGGSDLNALFRRADAALYAAKRAGRNRVELLEPDSEDLLPVLKATVRAAKRDSPTSLARARGASDAREIQPIAGAPC